MKGVKLLFIALLCLFTSGARAEDYNITYTSGDAGIDFHWVSDEEATTTFLGANAMKDINLNGKSIAYTFKLIDNNRGLVYFMPSLAENSYGDCYVGLATKYKTSGSNAKTSVKIPGKITLNYGGNTRTKNVRYIVDYGFTTNANGNNPDYNWTFTFNPSKSYAAPKTSTTTSYTFTPLSTRSGFYNPNLKSVTFADNSQITQIGIGAFQGCINLESIVIPSSVTEIFDNAFTYCIYTKSIEFQTTESTDATTGITTQKAGITYLP